MYAQKCKFVYAQIHNLYEEANTVIKQHLWAILSAKINEFWIPHSSFFSSSFFRLVTETPLTICSLSRTSVSDKCLTQFLMAISQLVWHHLT